MLTRMWSELGASITRRFSGNLQANLPTLGRMWMLLAMVLVAVRTVTTFGQSSPLQPIMLMMVLAAPVWALNASMSYYAPSILHSQPNIRFARLGRWRQLDALDCTAFEHYGAVGLLTMLLVGLLLNVPVRTFEFAAAMPMPRLYAPNWYLVLYSLMLADLALLATCYAGLVGLAVRRVPYFPRLLMLTWLLDIAAQITIGRVMSVVADVPAPVRTSLDLLLHGNIEKVAISMVLWVPYLLLSPRVNLTFRHRIRAKIASARV